MAQVMQPQKKKGAMDTAMQGLGIAASVSSIRSANAQTEQANTQTEAMKRRQKQLEAAGQEES